MTEQVNVYEAKSQLATPVARLVPEQPKARARRLGGLEGKVRVIGDWHEGDEEIADMILGRELDVSSPAR